MVSIFLYNGCDHVSRCSDERALGAQRPVGMGCVIHEGLVHTLTLSMGHNALGPEQRVLIPERVMEVFGTERHRPGAP